MIALDFGGRAPRLRATFEDAGCDALLVTTSLNIRYLTGFTGSAALLVVLPDELVFITDGRYADQAPAELAAAGVVARVEVGLTQEAQAGALTAAAAGVGRLGLEASNVTWAAQRAYDEKVFEAATLVPTEGLVEGLRAIKDEGEVARLAAASSIADAALAAVLPMLDLPLSAARADRRPTEQDVAEALEAEMRRRGSDGASFETIVAAGPNAALPHARPSRRAIVDGDLVVLDFGATVDGYHSDMTRTVVVGAPSATQRRMLEVVATSNAAGVAAVRGGVEAVDVDRACREVIEAAGWGEAFSHGTGHGIGLEIHEGPRLSRTPTSTLLAGHVVTIEPGVYLPEHGGVRVEDSVVVTDDGCTPITRAPKEWTWRSRPTT